MPSSARMPSPSPWPGNLSQVPSAIGGMALVIYRAMDATSFPKSEIKILLLENIHPVAKQAFAAEGFQIEMVSSALPEAELCARVADAHVLGIRSKTQVTAKVIDAGRRLLSVGAFCIGTNQVDLR